MRGIPSIAVVTATISERGERKGTTMLTELKIAAGAALLALIVGGFLLWSIRGALL